MFEAIPGIAWVERKVASARLENGVASWDPALRAVASSPEDNYVTMLLHLARTLLCLGHVGEARRRKAEALAEARALSPYTLAYALCQSWDDDWATHGVKSAHMVLRTAEELMTISHDQSFPMWSGFGSIMRVDSSHYWTQVWYYVICVSYLRRFLTLTILCGLTCSREMSRCVQ